MTQETKYPWFTVGDLNAFFGLMLDNVTNLVILTAILIGAGFDGAFIFSHMIPGTALGVMVGDLVYTWMAFRLAKRTGRTDVTAMPLGLDTPSTIGIAFAVLVPSFIAAGGGHAGDVDETTRQNAMLIAWQVGMATMMFIGLVKLGCSFIGEWVRKLVPQAGLLGSLAGVGIALLGTLQLVHIFHLPIVGITAFGLVLYTLVAKIKLPGNIPGAAAAVIGGTVLYYILGGAGALGHAFHTPATEFYLAFPTPTLGFVAGLGEAIKFLPVAIPFAVLTIVGGINVTESARVAGDDYSTRNILLTEACATLIAGMTGGVAQSTPYIGHPAYKAMGGRAGYTLATGLFIGLGGIFGYVSFIVDALPAAAVAPILIFVGLEIVSQTYETCPKSHFPAITLATLPTVANLVMFRGSGLVGELLGGFNKIKENVPALAETTLQLSQRTSDELLVISALGNGFILTAMLWGGFGAHLADRKLLPAAGFLFACAVLGLFGFIHSIDPSGKLYWPFGLESSLPIRIAAGYALFGVLLVILHFTGNKTETPVPEEA